MKFYCEEHGKDVYVSRLPGRVECYTESELLRHGFGEFPSEGFWEYCCNCETAWHSGSRANHQPSAQCPRHCPYQISVRYLCDQCGVFTLDSDDAIGERAYSVARGQSPVRHRRGEPEEPSCPGCFNPPLADVCLHKCSKLGIQFSSPRHECPFCLKLIAQLPSFPELAFAFLEKVPDQDKVAVAFDILDIEQNLLVPSPDGDFLLIGNGAGQIGSIVLPKRTRFTGKQDHETYSSLYDCEKPGAGEVRILSPAVADKLAGGWLSRERGRLEVVPAEGRTEESEANESFPTSVADYLKNNDGQNVVTHDLVDNTLKLDPTGELILKCDPDIPETQSGYVVPRLTNFPGKQGFLKYFKMYYERYYECKHPDSGEVWIINPAIVNKTHGGWTLQKRGVLEVRNKPEPPAPGPSNKVIPALYDIGSRVVEGDGAEKQLTDIDDTLPPKPVPKPLLPRTLMVSLAVIVTFFSFYGAVTLVRNLFSSSIPGNGVDQTPTPTPTPSNPTGPAGMVYIPGGEFLMGNDGGDDDEKPAHKVTVTPFYIDVNEVTCEEYEKFVKEKGRRVPANWVNGTYPSGCAKKPVTGVDWEDANAYAQRAKKRLPTEEEWEFAARGTTGLRYPWGNDWRAGAANAGDSNVGQFADVGSYPAGKGPFGTMDMIGNAWEWTATEWQGYPGGPVPPDASNQLRVIRGGYWGSSAPKATTTFRKGWDARGAKKGYQNTGFRCAADVTAPTSKK